MGHFVLDGGISQIHLYCRDVDTYEEIFERADENSAIVQVRPGREGEIPHNDRRIHIFVKESRIYAINLDASGHKGKTWKMPEDAANKLSSAFPGLRIPASRRIQTAPFGPGMISALTDF